MMISVAHTLFTTWISTICYSLKKTGFQSAALTLADNKLASDRNWDQDMGLETLLALKEPGAILGRLQTLQPRHGRPLLEWLLKRSEGGWLSNPTQMECALCGEIVKQAVADEIGLCSSPQHHKLEDVQNRVTASLILARSPDNGHISLAQQVLASLTCDRNITLPEDLTDVATSRLLELLNLITRHESAVLYVDLLCIVLEIAETILTPSELSQRLLPFERSYSTKQPISRSIPALLTCRLPQRDSVRRSTMVSTASLALRLSWRYGSAASYSLDRALQSDAKRSCWREACQSQIQPPEQMERFDVFRLLRSIHPSWPALSTWAREAHQHYLNTLPGPPSALHSLLVGRAVLFEWKLNYSQSMEQEMRAMESSCRQWLAESGFPLRNQLRLQREGRTVAAAIATLAAAEAYAMQLEIEERSLPHEDRIYQACEAFGRHFDRLLQDGELEAQIASTTSPGVEKGTSYMLERCRLLSKAWSLPPVKEHEGFVEYALRELAGFFNGEALRVDAYTRVRCHDIRLHRWLFVFPHLTLQEKLTLLEKLPTQLSLWAPGEQPILALWDGYCDRLMHGIEVNIAPALMRKLSHQIVEFLLMPENNLCNRSRSFLEEWEQKSRLAIRSHPMQLATCRLMARELREAGLTCPDWERGVLHRLSAREALPD